MKRKSGSCREGTHRSDGTGARGKGASRQMPGQYRHCHRDCEDCRPVVLLTLAAMLDGLTTARFCRLVKQHLRFQLRYKGIAGIKSCCAANVPVAWRRRNGRPRWSRWGRDGGCGRKFRRGGEPESRRHGRGGRARPRCRSGPLVCGGCAARPGGLCGMRAGR